MKKEDKIELMVDKMNKFADVGEYEKAKQVLDDIKIELSKVEEQKPPTFEEIFIEEEKPYTIKQVYNLLQSNPIRLNPDYYPFSKFFKLTIDVHKRLKNMKEPLRNINYTRKVVAEEMVCNKMVVPRTYRGKKPNRAFLDIALNVNPSLCADELQRRAEVKLWKAVKSGSKSGIESAKKELRDIKRTAKYKKL